MDAVSLAPPTVLPFKVSLDEHGYGRVEVEGVDVSDKVGALRFEVSNRGAILTLYGPAAGDIEGNGIIRTVADGDPRAYLENFLGQINPHEIDRKILDDSVDEPFNTQRVIAELLAVLHGG